MMSFLSDVAKCQRRENPTLEEMLSSQRRRLLGEQRTVSHNSAPSSVPLWPAGVALNYATVANRDIVETALLKRVVEKNV